ncbi:MAG TPA: 3-phosphoshikimate 1-carboxyvinyltransferase [Vicinamibacterales bacterium]|jgi:3-phosphoshikimate 1-carboxyvinyltransferase
MSVTKAAVMPPRVEIVRGRMRVPGDKSISHRYAMLAAIADGTSRIENYAPGADGKATLSCLEGFGVVIRRGAVIEIEGRGLGGLRAPAAPIDAANSGTSMRLLAGLAAAHPFRTVLGGDASLSRRPMRRVIDPLTRMGASIGSENGRPPLTIDGGALTSITHHPDVPSAQVKSAVLLAGLHAAGRTFVVESSPTRDHTERALEAFGVLVCHDGRAVGVDGGQRPRGIDARVPGDLSSAVFWLALAAGTPGSELVIDDVGLNPSRTAVLAALERAGARVESAPGGSARGEPVGRLAIRAGEPRSFEIGRDEVPLLIDEIPALAALAAMQPGVTFEVRGAGELRVKESDRIAMLARGFRALGVAVDEYDDGFRVSGGPPAGGEAHAAGDHRLAMAFAIAGSRARGPVRITGADAVAVSYPGFFGELERLAGSR